MISALGVIPARFKSSRFPGKPLAQIAGIPMIKRTYLQVLQSKSLADVLVATDDEAIFEYCVGEGIKVEMTSDECLTGTDRVAEIAGRHAHDLYVNVQGDEPIIDPIVISQIVDAYKEYGEGYIAYNLCKRITDKTMIDSSSIIKVIVNENYELMYMSRLAVPSAYSMKKPFYLQQIPTYGYTAKALLEFSSHSKTVNELYEDIEMLRFVDLGHDVKMIQTNAVSISVDKEEDILKVERHLIGPRTI